MKKNASWKKQKDTPQEFIGIAMIEAIFRAMQLVIYKKKNYDEIIIKRSSAEKSEIDIFLRDLSGWV